MKKKNSTCEFSSERSELLIRNFRESLARQSVISIKRAFQDAADAPAPRFWVSEARAMRIISLMMKGTDITEGMHRKKKEMYEEIFSRVSKIKSECPDKPLGDIVFEVVNDKAPESYITPGYVGKIIKNNRKHC